MNAMVRENLNKSFVGLHVVTDLSTRIPATQDRVINLRERGTTAPEVSLTCQRPENDLAHLERTRNECLEGLKRLKLARRGPVRREDFPSR